MAKLEKSFKSLNEKMEEFDKQFKKEGAALFKEICNEVFEKFPEVQSFSWAQYTPYFNDGDECVFSVNEVDTINEFNEYDYEDQKDEVSDPEAFNPWLEYEYDKKKTRSYQIVETLREFIDSAPEEVLRALFGDHTRVTVYRDKKAETEEYEHD